MAAAISCIRADPAGWAKGKDPAKRLDRALNELYAYYRANEAMLAHYTRDAAVQPALAQALDAAGAADLEQAMRGARASRSSVSSTCQPAQ